MTAKMLVNEYVEISKTDVINGMKDPVMFENLLTFPSQNS